MPLRPLLFPVANFLRKPKPAKAELRGDVQASVARSIQKLPALGQQNPNAALLIERSIDDWLPNPPPDDCDRWSALDQLVLVNQRASLDLEKPHFLLSRELAVFMVSDKLQAALGMEQREFRRHWREHIVAADTDALQRDFEQAMTNHEGFLERVFWRTGDGTLRGSLLQIEPRVFHGAFVGFTGLLTFDEAA